MSRQTSSIFHVDPGLTVPETLALAPNFGVARGRQGRSRSSDANIGGVFQKITWPAAMPATTNQTQGLARFFLQGGAAFFGGIPELCISTLR